MTPKRAGWIFVAVYCLVLAAIIAFVFSPYANHMSALLIVVAALPWSWIGHWIAPIWGWDIGTGVGLLLNGVAAYWLGYGCAVTVRRWSASSSGAPSRH